MSALLCVGCLALFGAWPAYRLVGRDWMVPVIAVLVGALCMAVGATVLVWLPTSVLMSGVLVAAAVNAAFMVDARVRRIGHDTRGGTLVATLVPSTALLVPLQALGVGRADWDARFIWFFHARWMYAGHDYFVTALKNPGFATYAHPDYPPLVSAAVAGAWRLSGQAFDYRLGQLVVTILNAAAVLALARGVVEAMPRPDGWWARIAGAAVTVGAFGMAGAYGVDGLADLLWAAAAAGAVVWGLILPTDARNCSVAVVLALVAGMTKSEGLATAVLVGSLITARLLLPGRRWPTARMWLLLAGVTAALLAWPVTAHAVHAISDAAHSGSVPRPGAPDRHVLPRIHPTVTALWHQLGLLGVVLLLSPFAWSRRKAHRLGHPGWIAAVLVASVLILATAYVVSPYRLHWLISNSMDRTTLFLRLTSFCVVTLWSAAIMSGLRSWWDLASRDAVSSDGEFEMS